MNIREKLNQIEREQIHPVLHNLVGTLKETMHGLYTFDGTAEIVYSRESGEYTITYVSKSGRALTYFGSFYEMGDFILQELTPLEALTGSSTPVPL